MNGKLYRVFRNRDGSVLRDQFGDPITHDTELSEAEVTRLLKLLDWADELEMRKTDEQD